VSAFPAGNTFLTFAVDPYLRGIPLILTAPPEIELPEAEWSTNAYCGLIMNNFVAKKIGRRIFTLGGWPKEKDYQAEFRRLLRVVGAVAGLRHELVGRFGDAPSGFHSATGDQLAWANLLGPRVETIDLSAVMQVFDAGEASGLKGKSAFTEKQVQATFRKMTRGREVLTERGKVKRAARLFHAMRALIEANGFTSAAVRCWPELAGSRIGITACLTVGWLLSEGVVRGAACEGDWPTAICQSIAAMLSGRPAACLDFVNDLSRKCVVELGHCGVGIPCLMHEAKIGDVSPDRQAGNIIGPTCIGQFRYGVKTGLCLIQDEHGRFKMLAFTGESRPDTDRKIRYAAADVEVKNHRKLGELILEHGFTHHLAVALGDITPELKLLCHFYGIEYLSPDGG
jgi:L-fucose isomerase-like protein